MRRAARRRAPRSTRPEPHLLERQPRRSAARTEAGIVHRRDLYSVLPAPPARPPGHQVRLCLGGPRSRSAVEQHLDAIGTQSITSDPGTFVIADMTTDWLFGTLVLDRRDADLPGHITEEGGELDLSYLLRREAWGTGLAFEAATTALSAAADELPDQPVLVVTQTANERSLKLAARLGFQRMGTFEAYDAEQTLAVTNLHSFKA
ncbi:GNAT family N-acetyltransferase [Streptomyces noursei]|uniref:GNAT family N-acetyltransferase n=1 Tax=Streptomyces noursei TaxID=1971 RepID=UPI0037F85621